MVSGSKKRPTLKTIAQMSGLGVTTVSKALRDAPDIGVKTKERVKLIAKQIGYQPDRAGLRLRTGKTNVISLVLDVEEEVIGVTSPMIVGITQALEGTPYNLIVKPYSHKNNPLQSVRQVVETRAADGIILSRVEPNDARISYLQEAGMPFATHGRSDMSVDHAFYDFDNTSFGYDAVKTLSKLGRQRIGLVAPPKKLSFAHHMLSGFERGLSDAGVEGVAIQSVTTDDALEHIATHIGKLFSERDRPDGIICGSVGSTVGVVNGVERAGLLIGKDVDVVSKQSTANFLKWYGRPLYSIKEDFRATGFGLAKSLMALIDGEPVCDHQTLAYPHEAAEKVSYG